MAGADAIDECAAEIGQEIFRMSAQRLVEGRVRRSALRHGRGLHFAHQVGMTANSPLPENNHAARQNVRALHGNGDGNRLVSAPDVIRRPHADAATAVYIHRIIDNLAHVLSVVTLQNRGNDRRFFATIEPAQGQQAARLHHVSHAADARQRFLDTLEFTNRSIELLAQVSIGAGIARAGFPRRNRERGKRYAAPHR